MGKSFRCNNFFHLPDTLYFLALYKAFKEQNIQNLPMTIEVCVDSVASAVNAAQGGASRVELCDNLFEGGTTPSAGMIEVVRNKIDIGLQVMLRPRGGDFLYSEEEYAVIKRDMQVARELGADGVVFGFLTPEGNIDKPRTEELIALARPMNSTFHRAFDMSRDPFQALEDLIQLGVDRVLTSGQERTAIEGMELIAELVKRAGDRIIILAGGGVRPHNIQKLVQNTGVKECHVSGRKAVASGMQHQNHKVGMGGALQLPEYQISVVDAETIQSFKY